MTPKSHQLQRASFHEPINPKRLKQIFKTPKAMHDQATGLNSIVFHRIEVKSSWLSDPGSFFNDPDSK